MSEEQKKPHAYNMKVITPIAAAIIVGGLGFAGGVQYQKGKGGSSTTTSAASLNARDGMNGQQGQLGGGRMGGGFGTVKTISTTSITISSTRSGTDTTLAITADTEILDGASAASVNDIKAGDQVIARASTSDTKTAAMITINPTMPTGGPGGMMQAQPDSTSTTVQ